MQVDDSLLATPESSADALVLAWAEESFNQSFTVTDFRNLVVVDHELDTSSGEWVPSYYSGSSTFDIHMATSNGRDKFYLFGLDASERAVVEEWRLEHPKYALSGAPPHPKTLRRKELYRGELPNPPVALEVDPEGRFFLFLTGPPESRCLFSFPVHAHAQPTLLYDTTTLPELAGKAVIHRMDHASLGRIWLFEDDATMLILVDSNNDGAFEEPPITGSIDSIYESGLLDVGQWADTFFGTSE